MKNINGKPLIHYSEGEIRFAARAGEVLLVLAIVAFIGLSFTGHTTARYVIAFGLLVIADGNQGWCLYMSKFNKGKCDGSE